MKSITKMKAEARNRRRLAIRKKLSGTPERPRMAVFRSLKHIYVQIIDDETGRTLVSMSTKAKGIAFPAELSVILPNNVKVKDEEAKPEEPKPVKLSRRMLESYVVGEMIGKKAIEAGITSVSFDRAGYKYHGRVKALAEGARKAGLQF